MVFRTDKDFEFKFLEDGVYICINNMARNAISLSDVLERINRKQIKEYDLDIIVDVINGSKSGFVRFAPKQEEILINEEVLIDISKDKMYGYVTLLPPDGGKNIEFDEFVNKVKEIIKYGLNYEKLREIFENKVYNKKICIAKGKKPVQGKDGYIVWHFNIENKHKPKILKDGSVDYRNLNIINNVKKGQLLAERIPATTGENGVAVTGEIIPSIKGKEKILKAGKNVVLSDDGNSAYALKDGQVIYQDEKIVVYEVYEIIGNVDNATGNIYFNGTVKIKGNVITGFCVKAMSDIEINGVVEGAIVESNGNIIVKRGIQGYHKGKLISKGNIYTKFIENSNIYANLDIHAEAIMHSKVISGNNIEVNGKKGLIVGGVCKAKNEIRAKTIGSQMGTITVLEVGIDPELKQKHTELKNRINEIRLNIEKVDKTIKVFTRLVKNNSLPDEKKELLVKIIDSRQVLTNELETLKEQLINIEEKIKLQTNGKVKVEKEIFPGVKIAIGNSVMFVRERLGPCTFMNVDGEIRITSFEK
ncbi:hypothetical protein TR13x_02315 [Caloranaerobacter sp. TR13]|uniref:DUF342 domain-containing protein n=1 Tax=Caloranaerobacter sp. TR13 TaxID=1302151 RepID=UPI0006D43D1C|nr:FapA family protein [Caloranaerobacter sp. TR13]KPU28191.1 hypothetical protein TR13x_02315 [Caloranaerobacter sp. TR13]